MKHPHFSHRAILLLFCLLATHQLLPQEFSNRYGKVTDEELKMTSYESDTTANAVVIFKKGITRYEYINNNFRVDYQVEVKIKILKHEGTKYADVSIPFLYNEKNLSMKEIVTGIDASAYNMENGKAVRTKMKREYIFKERLSDSRMQMKFSIPAVKAGTVIEYKYKILSDYYYALNSWEIQQDIPVAYNHYELSIPEYFKFNFDMRGGQKIEFKEDAIPQSLSVRFNQRVETIQCMARDLHFTGQNIPALKSDSYVWCPDDYKSQVHFELKGLEFPGALYKSYTTTWEAIDEQLLRHEDFGRLLKIRNPLRDEMQSLSLEGLTDDQKISALFTFLKQRVSWNGRYRLFGESIRKSITEGTASNSTLNFILISMLKEAGIPAYPVVINPRNGGIIPYAHPSLNKINTFIVGIANTDSTLVFLDGSVSDGFINTLPPVLLADRGRIVSESPGEKWVSPMNIGRNSSRTMIKATVTEEGDLQADRESLLIGQYAAAFRKEYKAAKDTADFLEKKEAGANIKITSFSQQGADKFSPEVSKKYSFTKSLNRNREFIYINPMLFRHITENPFTQETRDLPVEFPYLQNMQIAIVIEVPGNYTVDEMPKSANITLPENKGMCRYILRHTGNQITLNYLFVLNKTLFAIGEYNELKEFFEHIAVKNNEMIVLKKASQ